MNGGLKQVAGSIKFIVAQVIARIVVTVDLTPFQDTVLGIAKSNKTTVENLAKSNKKIRELTLPVGTVLLIDKAK